MNNNYRIIIRLPKSLLLVLAAFIIVFTTCTFMHRDAPPLWTGFLTGIVCAFAPFKKKHFEIKIR